MLSTVTTGHEQGDKALAWRTAAGLKQAAVALIALTSGVGGLLAALGWLPFTTAGDATAVIVALASFMSICLLLLVWWSERQAKRILDRAADQQSAQRWMERRLKEIVDALPEAVIVYDSDDRLVLCNAKFRDMISRNGGVVRYGAKFEDQIRRSVELGVYADIADPETWIARQKEGLRASGPPQTFRLVTGSWMQFANQVLSDGSVVGIRTDVTSYKQRELDLANREARLSQLFATLADVVLELSANGIITYANPATRDILGFEPDELEGMRLVDLFTATDHDRLTEMCRRLNEGGAQSEAVVRYTRPSGEAIHVEIRLWLSSRPSGEQIVTGTIRDVTTRETAAAMAAREGAVLTSIANAAGVHVLVLDGEGKLLRANATFRDLLGVDSQELERRPLSASPKTSPLAAVIEPAIRDGGAADFPFEFDVVLCDGSDAKHTIRFAASAVPDVDGSLRYAVMIGIDDTARRNAETALFESAKLAKLGEMAAAMAHELNQPLAVIRMAAENTMQELEVAPPPDAALTDFLNVKLNRIASQTERAAKVISQLRAHARPGDEQPSRFDAPEAVNGALDLVREQLKLDGVKIAVASEACPPIVGHRSRFEQVVINLMTNGRDAIKMMPAATRGQTRGRIDVRIAPSADRKHVLLSVRDSGPGIPPQVLARLFEPFFTTKPKGQGTGLGLSICHGIVGDMGGTLTARNHPEGGAVFEIDLPAAAAGFADQSAAPAVADQLVAPAA
ncbi:MAG TPA: PAS domain S-box protein [Vineibacter sp.]|nr:PAS domain S-box protein [Vineibacter sp.]